MWHITSRGWDPWTERPLPEVVRVAYPLDEVKARFPAAAYYHIGDTDLHQFYATTNGFRFLRADPEAHRAWSVELFDAPLG